MSIYELVLSAMLTWPSNPNDPETANARRARIEMTAASVARAVDLAAMTGRWPAGRPRLELAAHTVSTIRYESGWLSRKVHEGEAVGDLDEHADRRGSYCLMQINTGTGRPVRSLVGVNQAATNKCVWVGVQILAWSTRQCVSRGWLGMASLHTSYTAGYRCRPSADGLRRGRYALSLWRDWRRKVKAAPNVDEEALAALPLEEEESDVRVAQSDKAED